MHDKLLMISNMFSTILFDILFGRCMKYIAIAAVAQQILVDLAHSLVAQPFCRPNDIFDIF